MINILAPVVQKRCDIIVIVVIIIIIIINNAWI